MDKIIPNQKQKECIENIKGKYLVLAGPGTGKTFTVIERIKNMLDNKIDPSKILCLTFTDTAAAEMKIRLEKRIDKISSGVKIFTYHSFCSDIIEKNPEEFERSENYKIITETISKAFVKECIDEIDPKYHRTAKNDPYFYINEIKNNIDEIKKNRLNKEKYFENLKNNPDWIKGIKILEDELENPKSRRKPQTIQNEIEELKKKIDKAIELWDFFELYQAKMEEKRYIDFNDMINCVLDKFENNPSFLEKIANEFEYILVDEYQDTNKSQNAIVFHLAHALSSENIFVVGDDDQIIYSFQGAKLDTIENFLESFPETRVICLNENMRSTQNILDCARKVAFQDINRLENNPKFQKYGIDKNLISKNENLKEKNSKVCCYKYVDVMQENNEIISKIESLINSPSCPKDENGAKKLSEIAILTSTNAELSEFANLLKEKNIPYELKEGKNIFEISCVNILYYYLQMLINPLLYANRFFELLLIKPFSLNEKDYLKIKENISREACFLDVLKKIDKYEFEDYKKIENFIETYEYLRNYKNCETIKNTILETGAKTGIFDYYLNEEVNRCENIAGLKKFVDTASDFSSIYKTGFLEEFLKYLDLLQKDEVAIKTDKAPVTLNAVQLLTYFSAKGREFEYVFMPNLNARKWESSAKSNKPKIPLEENEYKNKEELKQEKHTNAIKVLYVGMTRAKHSLQLSYVQKQQKSAKSLDLTKFIANIQEELEKEPVPFEYNENSYWQECAKTLIKKDYDYKKEFKNLIDSKLNNRAFSPSSVNKYLKCPRQYFYEKILNFEGLDGNPNNKSFGSAVHFALEFANKFSTKNQDYPNLDKIIQKFKENFNTLPMSDFKERKNIEKRGETALSNFYAQFKNTPVDMFFEAEYELFFEIEDLKFFGIIDRVDKNKDGTFTLYDYKTGNPKKLNQICPMGEYENYYNQMGLYKYFFEKSTGKKISKTEFIFVEDCANNLEIQYSKEDIDEILNKFKSAIKNILEHNFEPSFNKNACKYCEFHAFCKMNVI